MTSPEETRSHSKVSECRPDHKIGEPGTVGEDLKETVLNALDFLIDGELKLLQIYDARQSSADARTTTFATAAIALPTLILSLSKAFGSNAGLLHVGYLIVVGVAIIILIFRAWNAWRSRRHNPDEQRLSWLRVSSESADVAAAQTNWRHYQDTHSIGEADPIRVRQLALEIWRARAEDSRAVAQIKDFMSVGAATLLIIALVITGILLLNAHVG